MVHTIFVSNVLKTAGRVQVEHSSLQSISNAGCGHSYTAGQHVKKTNKVVTWKGRWPLSLMNRTSAGMLKTAASTYGHDTINQAYLSKVTKHIPNMARLAGQIQ
jgi:hypothetical protein